MRDADAVARARLGESDGLAQIYEGHAKGLYRLIYRLAASEADAEDTLHDLFVALPELLRRYEDRGKLGAWLRQVATRMTLMRLRAQRRRREVPIEKAGAIAQRAVPNDAFLIERAILALPDHQREVFVLRQLEGYEYQEISELLEISPGAARVRYLRALRRLRQLLENA